MFKDSQTINSRHKKFIETVFTTGKVYRLINHEGGFATSRSNNYGDENGESVRMTCFWSDVSLANYLQK
ncbi:DUF2750 domain-containing protein [Flammeovirga aprica]|uniref:DUF2750 domain-containing protein n=1 Tax=Flammeovirga aprica JL-4 TaxID=694437 RepID=A0A7X9RYK0_9BACT|nr:DUF2750 domain-containing protein [Flammeovirga aprica]NME71093.1 DUF2750 domain-containing protein [Flammeovirga aprica JL-4]